MGRGPDGFSCGYRQTGNLLEIRAVSENPGHATAVLRPSLGAEQEGRAGAVAEVQDWFSFTHRVMFANLSLSGPA